ncbi:siderophore-interacting protein [Parafrankia sp. FMc2]|uniref:siderophore-interacting protein n=1 Tax=Parafrankia sp. FMc2 TaxID=3233196 RepID=UPI0034D5DC58
MGGLCSRPAPQRRPRGRRANFDGQPAVVEWRLLVRDESGLLAVAGICESLPRDVRGEAFLEVPGPGDVQEINAPAGVRLNWPGRKGPRDRPRGLAQAAITASDEHGDRACAFIVDESAMNADVRQFLMAERALREEGLSCYGCWRHRYGTNHAVSSPPT